ncbi:unnamed protein product [Nesidiocoris tenuis]|uniref:NADH dehydrogenase [ubiquinone] 1 beta subcomplex subunit 7 n=2 Tax=Nesidiocoris tenuis TaxID=355587 RepID=A0A6H5GWW1_9HEMI|nr:NADH dehydrogenase (ubiquinone) 1 beta subcomplex [Nesidiocoris tenuis]CAB0008313.1 unnamed protein product [Nesidiocoris tenuis]CAB0008317.1 unnamed protein product [Nesidiocoris tenuis]
MGNLQAGIDYKLHPDVVPHPNQKSKWDPNYGFESPRKEKVMIATEEEMHSAKIALEDRDFCAHHLIDYKKCYHDKFPFVNRCHHEKHVYLNCRYAEFVDTIKDYERERRLMERQKRIAASS